MWYITFYSLERVFMKYTSFKPIVLSIAISLVSGCGNISVEPIKNSTQLGNTYQELHQILNTQKPIDEQISLPSAIARALKYNLEHRAQKAQALLEYGNLEMAYLAMLPSVDAEVNYSFRNNNYIQNIVNDSGQATKGNLASPRDILNESAGLQWSLLDFGLSYTRALKQANTLLISEEQKRRTTQKLIQEVTGAYWKAWAAQEMSSYVDEIKVKAQKALARSQQITNSNKSSPQSELVYQQELIRSIRKVNRLAIQIHDAKSNLLKLINAKVGQKFSLTEPYDSIRGLPKIIPQFEKMDMLALVFRPELREASYESANAKKNIHEAIISMLPVLQFDFGYNHTNNNYIFNKDWWQGNVNASWNILKAVTSGPKAINIASHGYSLAKLRQAAVTMTILTQIRVAFYAYELQREDYTYSKQEYTVSKGLADYARNLEQAKSGNEQLTIRRYIDYLSAQF